MMQKKQMILLTILLCVILLAVIIGKIVESTHLNNNIKLKFIAQHINNYIDDYNKYPASLTEINVKKNFLKDEWGRFFIYKKGKNKITLISYGEDGKKGGVKTNQDIYYSFEPMKPK